MNEWPSNFWAAQFIWDWCGLSGQYQKFFCTEQAFMYAKAQYFGDLDTADEIMKVDDPRKAKQLGRQVKSYDDDKWSQVRFDYMYSCNWAKYSQNNYLYQWLLDSKYNDLTWVELSLDRIWGCGMSRSTHSLDDFDDEFSWTGQNLMGQVITKVRKSLINNENKLSSICKIKNLVEIVSL